MITDYGYAFENSDTINKIMRRGREAVRPGKLEERDLIAAAQGGDERARERLLYCHAPFVMSIAARYRGRGVETSDLFQCGWAGLDKAITRFDLGRADVGLLTYAVEWVRASILVEVANNADTVRIPINRRVAMAKIAKLVRSGKVTDPSTLGSRVGVSEKVARDLAVYALGVKSLNQEALFHPNDGDSPEIQDLLAAGEGLSYDDVSEFEWTVDMCRSVLTERSMYVFMQRNVEGRMLNDIGKELGISRERVRQIGQRAMTLVRREAARRDKASGFTREDRITMLSMGN